MAFATTTMKCSARSVKLNRAMSLLQQLIELNDLADRMRVDLIANGVTDPEDTINKILDAGGPPFVVAATDITPTGDTLSDELILLLSTTANGIGWEYLAE